MSAPCGCHVFETVPVERATFLGVAHCPRHSEAHVAKLETDRDQLLNKNEEASFTILKLKGEWPATGAMMKQGVHSTLIFPLDRDQTAVSIAVAHLLREGWQFVGIQMQELHLQRTWEYDEEDAGAEVTPETKARK